MTARQIAKAIEYNLKGTEKALGRMERDGQVHRDGADSWAIGMIALAHRDGHAGKGGNGSYQAPRDGSSRAPDLSPTAKLEICIAFCDLPKNEAALAL
jgi:hypothetical protein